MAVSVIYREYDPCPTCGGKLHDMGGWLVCATGRRDGSHQFVASPPVIFTTPRGSLAPTHPQEHP